MQESWSDGADGAVFIYLFWDAADNFIRRESPNPIDPATMSISSWGLIQGLHAIYFTQFPVKYFISLNVKFSRFPHIQCFRPAPHPAGTKILLCLQMGKISCQQYNQMNTVALLLTLLVLSAGYECPLAAKYRATAFSGTFKAEPKGSSIAQDILYKNTYNNALALPSQVGLGVSGYRSGEVDKIHIEVSAQEIQNDYFVCKVQSPANNRWGLLEVNYLVTTKADLEIVSAVASSPQYNSFGHFPVSLKATQTLSSSVKIRPYISGLDVNVLPNGVLKLSYEKLDRKADGSADLWFSSSSCYVNKLVLTVVIFDPTPPGVLYLDGLLEQNSISSQTTIEISKNGMEELRIYFVGLTEFSIKKSSALWISVSMDSLFRLVVDAKDVDFIGVSYLILSFVECGTCDGYPYIHNDVCSKNCPLGTQNQGGYCIPINCGAGYVKDSQGNCIPACGPYAEWSGRICTCISGYNLINNECQQCPAGTYFNYKTLACESLCGPYADYNPRDQLCYCHNGYYVVDGICGKCPAGYSYNANTKHCDLPVSQCKEGEEWTNFGCQCLPGYTRIQSQGICVYCYGGMSWNPQSNRCECPQNSQWNPQSASCVVYQNCEANQIWTGSRCDCVDGYNWIGGFCKKCPANSSYSPSTGYCLCNPGFSLVNGACQVTCPPNQVWVNGYCQCLSGLVRNSQGICSKQCPTNEVLDHYNNCVCVPGYERKHNGVCYVIACPLGQKWNASSNQCVSICSGGQHWDESRQGCASCASGYIWDKSQCVCQYGNCNGNQCPAGYFWNYNTNRCEIYPQNCNSNQVWNGTACNCKAGFYEVGSGNCFPYCGPNEELILGACTCKALYSKIGGNCVCTSGVLDVNGNCKPAVITCNSYQVWNGTHCVCRNGYYQAAPGVCIPLTCQANEVLDNNNVCVCKSGFRKVSGVCQPIPCPLRYVWNDQQQQCILPPNSCPANQVWNGSACIPSCNEGEVWSGFVCSCKDGYERTVYDTCVIKCPLNENRISAGGSCVCNNGFERKAGVCVPIACGGGLKLDPLTGNCVPLCPPPHYYNPSTGQCVCANGFELYNGNCVTACQPGFIRNSVGNCQLTCNSDQVLDNGQCKCRVGLYLINGQCSQCPANSRLVGSICLCYGSNQQPLGNTCSAVQCQQPNSSFDPATGTCKCNSPYIWIYGQCSSVPRCSQYQYWNGVSCECVYGYFKVNGVCQYTNQHYFCPPNSYFNGVNCQCNPGYQAQGNQCLACPAGYYWNGQSCGLPQQCSSGYQWDSVMKMCVWSGYNCDANQYWNGCACVCKTSFYWISNKCGICPPGSIYDGRQCTSGQVDRSCDGPYQFWNGVTCACVPGFFLVDNYCVTCPQGTSWNGYYCKPVAGLLRSIQESSSSSNGNTVAVSFK